MTLDEADAHASDVADNCGSVTEECQIEHRQLRDWLNELRSAREILKNVEWSSYRWHNHTQKTEYNLCPICCGRRPSHEENCEIERLLRMNEG